jgi:hypothetical protein
MALAIGHPMSGASIYPRWTAVGRIRRGHRGILDSLCLPGESQCILFGIQMLAAM